MGKNRKRSSPAVLLSNEGIVNEYFRLISEKDVEGLLELFDDNAVVYEPFSKMEGLRGKGTIENFLKVAVMANSGFVRTIRFKNAGENEITVLVTFEKGSSITGKFSFTFVTQIRDTPIMSRKISELRIQFL